MRPTRLYRVLPWLEDAKEGDPGHPLFIHTPQGSGRVDNPEQYLVLYVSDDPAGAVGESLGNVSRWTRRLLNGTPQMPTSRRALATYKVRADVDVLDLDDPRALVDRDLRPSRVVTRDRVTTQSWASGIFQERDWAGARWWSYHYPEWGSFGMWDMTSLTVTEVNPLEDELEVVSEAARLLNKEWEG